MTHALRATLALIALTGCVNSRSYPAVATPRFTGTPVELRTPTDSLPAPAELTVVSFNVQEGENIDAALVSLGQLPPVDIVLLQEMGARGTARIANELGMAWRYYPTVRRNGRGFGNAVLSRFPIVDDAKVILPHDAWLTDAQRIATAATIDVGGVAVRAYSVHLATGLEQGPGNRREQLTTVLEDASPYSLAVLGGDLNSSSVAEAAVEAGWAWPTAEGPRTHWSGRVDHIVVRGSVVAESGTGTDPGAASDHDPVWVRLRLPDASSDPESHR